MAIANNTGAKASDEMKIDELAQRAGTTTRNVRAYQTKGLLPSPRMVGRVGFYGDGHLARLRYIDHLQQKGFSLAAIHDLLNAWEQGRSVADILGFETALTAPWSTEASESITKPDLERLFPEIIDNPQLIERSVKLGLLVRDSAAFKVVSPRLMEVGAELVSAGIPLSAVLDEHEKLAADVNRIAEQFIHLFNDHVWEPFVAAGLPAEQLPRITETILRLRPAALIAVQALLERAMETAVANSTAEQVQRFTTS